MASLFRQPWRGFLLATGAGLFLAITGALGTGEAPFVRRLLYWLLVMNVGATLGAFVSPVISGWGGLNHRPIREGALISLVIAVPLTIVLIGANYLFFNSVQNLADIAIIFGAVWMISALMTALNYATSAPKVIIVERADPTNREAPRLMARLPLRLQHANIQALQAEDHYLRIHTDQGSELILMRLSDAIAEVEGIEGAQCHRSWWVARSAVANATRRDGRATLTIGNTTEVPISRKYLPELRAGGWLR